MVEVPLAWKIFVSGGASAKAEFQRLHEELEKGEITWEQYQKQTREVKQGLSAVKDQVNVSKRAFEATHPSLINFTRAMGGIGSVLHASTAALSLVNLSQIALSSTTSTVAEEQLKAEQAQRDYNDAVRQFGQDSPQAKDALSKWNIEQQRLKEVTDQFDKSKIDSLLSVGTSIAFIGTSAASATKNIPEFAKLAKDVASKIGLIDKSSLFTTNRVGTLTGALANVGRDTSSISSFTGALRNIESSAIAASGAVTGLSGAVGASGGAGAAGAGLVGAVSSAIGPLGAVAGQLGAIAAAWGSIRPLVEQFAKGAFGTQTAEAFSETPSLASRLATNPLTDTGPVKSQFDATNDSLQKLLQSMDTDLPSAGQKAMDYLQSKFAPSFNSAWAGTWNKVITTSNTALTGLVGGLQTAMSAVIQSMNRAIEGYNNAAAKLGKPGIATLGNVSLSFQQIPMIAAANGFSGVVSSPTVFLAGEAGKPEMINIAPMDSGSIRTSTGGTTIINNNHYEIKGSLWSTRQLSHELDGINKRELTRRNFRPFG